MRSRQVRLQFIDQRLGPHPVLVPGDRVRLDQAGEVQGAVQVAIPSQEAGKAAESLERRGKGVIVQTLLQCARITVTSFHVIHGRERVTQGEKSPAQLALADYLSKTGRTSLCLTPGEWETPHDLSRPPARYLTLAADLHAAGVPLMLGTDAPCLCVTPGDSVRQELRNLAAAGLSPYEALRTATANPAEFLGMDEEFGSVEAGKRADLLLLDENPLENLAAVETIIGVMVNGRWLTADDLEELRQSHNG